MAWWGGGLVGGIVGMVVVWNGRPPSPAGAFSAGRPSADAGLSANNGKPLNVSFFTTKAIKVSFGHLKFESDINNQINCECQTKARLASGGLRCCRSSVTRTAK